VTEPDHVSSQAVYNAAAEMYAQLVGTELSAAFEARRPLAATHGALSRRPRHVRGGPLRV